MTRSLSRVLLPICGALVPLLVLELALRLIYPQAVIRTFDKNLGTYNLPNLDVRETFGGFEVVVRVRTNSIGLRTREVDAHESDRAARILALGDSFTFGDEVEAENAWPEQLERILNASRGRHAYEVVNAGVSGYGTAQELILYQRLAGGVHPAAVVLGFVVENDLLNNLCIDEGTYREQSDAPCFALRNGRLDLTAPREHLAKTSGISRLRAWDFLLTEIRRATVWNPAFLRLLQTLDVHVSALHPDATIESWYNSKYFEPGWALTRQLIMKLRDVAAAQGTPLVVLIIPSSLQVNRRQREARAMLSQEDPVAQEFFRDPMRPQRLMLAFCAEAAIYCVDSTPALVRSEARKTETYYPINRHWTPAAHHVAAALIGAAREY